MICELQCLTWTEELHFSPHVADLSWRAWITVKKIKNMTMKYLYRITVVPWVHAKETSSTCTWNTWTCCVNNIQWNCFWRNYKVWCVPDIQLSRGTLASFKTTYPNSDYKRLIYYIISGHTTDSENLDLISFIKNPRNTLSFFKSFHFLIESFHKTPVWQRQLNAFCKRYLREMLSPHTPCHSHTKTLQIFPCYTILLVTSVVCISKVKTNFLEL